MAEQFKVDINDYQSVTATLYAASKKNRAGVTLILGHGAGAGLSFGRGKEFLCGLYQELCKPVM